MKATTILILITALTQFAETAPASKGNFDLHSEWWTGDLGSSGSYLTEEFRNSVFIPVMKSIVGNLEGIKEQQLAMESTDNIMAIILTVAVSLNTLALIYLHKKNSDK